MTVINCPGCNAKIRIPAVQGKKLKVSCPNMHQFLYEPDNRNVKAVSFKLTDESLKKLKNEGLFNITVGLEGLKDEKYTADELIYILQSEIGKKMAALYSSLILEYAEYLSPCSRINEDMERSI